MTGAPPKAYSSALVLVSGPNAAHGVRNCDRTRTWRERWQFPYPKPYHAAVLSCDDQGAELAGDDRLTDVEPLDAGATCLADLTIFGDGLPAHTDPTFRISGDRATPLQGLRFYSPSFSRPAWSLRVNAAACAPHNSTRSTLGFG